MEIGRTVVVRLVVRWLRNLPTPEFRNLVIRSARPTRAFVVNHPDVYYWISQRLTPKVVGALIFLVMSLAIRVHSLFSFSPRSKYMEAIANEGQTSAWTRHSLLSGQLVWSGLPKVLLVYYPQKILSIPRKTSQRLTCRIKNVSLSVSQMWHLGLIQPRRWLIVIRSVRHLFTFHL